jgi:hypothetical protein
VVTRLVWSAAGLLAAIALLAAAAAAGACNPIFGIVDRAAGPTYCEQDAQAGFPYCDDFDRVPASTTAIETQVNQGGNLVVTSAVSNSAPNSLEITGAPGQGPAFTGRLATYASPTVGVRCSVDVDSSDLSKAFAGGGQFALLGIGAPLSGTAGFKILLLGGNGQTQRLSLATVTGTTGAGEDAGCPIPSPDGGASMIEALGSWTTFSIGAIPFEPDGGIPPPPCTISDVDVDSGAQPWIVRVNVGPIDLGNYRVSGDDLMGLSYMAYGVIAFPGSTPVTLHVDNARCEYTTTLDTP